MGARWKREVVQDHKFDFINVDDFVDNSCWRQFMYSLVFAAIIRGILVYCSDIFTAANLLANSNENSFVPKSGVQLELFGKLPFEVYKWLFAGCIILGFFLLGLEIRRARAIIISKDISYAFTSLIASRYYTVKSYPHFCFFAQINNSKKLVDEVAFFCFFTFRSWKRLMLADAPRQVINATILYQTFRGHSIGVGTGSIFDWDEVVGVGNQYLLKKISLGAMIFTVFMFVISLLLLLSAVILYIPLVSHIQGNLKEYCCHKIDKRIDELIRKKSRTRAADEAGKYGKDSGPAGLKQPTLPQVDMVEPATAPANTPRNAYSQKSPAHYPAPTPKPAYNFAQPSPGLQQQQIQQRQRQQQQQQQEYTNYPPANVPAATSYTPAGAHFQAKPLPAAMRVQTPDAVSPYTDAAYGGGAYGFPNTGPNPGYYSGSNVNANNGNSPYASQAPPRIARHDAYGQQQRPGSSTLSQPGSDRESHRGSGGGGYNSGVGVGAVYGNNNVRSSGQSNEFQTSSRWQGY